MGEFKIYTITTQGDYLEKYSKVQTRKNIKNKNKTKGNIPNVQNAVGQNLNFSIPPKNEIAYINIVYQLYIVYQSQQLAKFLNMT